MNVPDPEVTRHIDAVRVRGGSAPDLRERDRAIAWLLANADRAFPDVLGRAAAAPADVVMLDLLGRFRRPEATPVLARAFALGDPPRRYAAGALGASPDPAARTVLRDALTSPKPGDVAAALAGLGVSADPLVCPDVRARLADADAEVRWAAVQAGGALGCLSAAELATIARDDADPEVRKLAAGLVAPR